MVLRPPPFFVCFKNLQKSLKSPMILIISQIEKNLAEIYRIQAHRSSIKTQNQPFWIPYATDSFNSGNNVKVFTYYPCCISFFYQIVVHSVLLVFTDNFGTLYSRKMDAQVVVGSSNCIERKAKNNEQHNNDLLHFFSSSNEYISSE